MRAAKLPHDFFPRLGVLAHAFQVDRVERESGRFDFVVMAADAIPIECGPLRRDRTRCRTGSCCCAPPAPADADNIAKPPTSHTSQRLVIRASDVSSLR